MNNQSKNDNVRNKLGGKSLPRFAYVSLALRWSPGIHQKLVSQAGAATRNDLPMKFYWILPSQPTEKVATLQNSALEFVEVRAGFDFLPRWLRAIYVRWQQVRLLNKLTKVYDAVVVRYPLFDPVVVLLLRPANIIWEHHTNDTEELKSSSLLRFFLEKTCRSLMFQKSIAYTAISQEIASILSKPYGGRPGCKITNSLDFSSYHISEDAVLIPDDSQLEFVMVASTYSVWHGLDRVLTALAQAKVSSPLVFHVVGMVPESLRNEFESAMDKSSRIEVRFHGMLSKEDLIRLYEKCCLGIGSFGFDRIAIKEGASLKTREYLACGLPVYSGSVDSGLPETFPYYLALLPFSVSSAIEFVSKHKRTTRGRIRAHAERFLGTEVVSQELIAFTTSMVQTSNNEQC